MTPAVVPTRRIREAPSPSNRTRVTNRRPRCRRFQFSSARGRKSRKMGRKREKYTYLSMTLCAPVAAVALGLFTFEPLSTNMAGVALGQSDCAVCARLLISPCRGAKAIFLLSPTTSVSQLHVLQRRMKFADLLLFYDTHSHERCEL